MADVRYDAAAVAIVKFREGAVMFKGWVGPLDDDEVAADLVVTAKRIRLFTYRDFREWLEIASADVLYRADANADDPEHGSVIWVKREAFIRKCHSARAYELDEQMADDPTARHPRP